MGPWRLTTVLTVMSLPCYIGTVDIFQLCDNSSICPANSLCKANGCSGRVCLCDAGFVVNDQLTACVKGADLGGACDGSTLICRDKRSVCIQGVCQCRPSYVPALDNLRCKIKPFFGLRFSLLREFCDGSTTLCQRKAQEWCDPDLSVCVCRPGLRPATPEELSAAPFVDHECRPENFSLSLPREDLICVTEDPPVSAGIGEHCLSYNNCPQYADCLPRGCDGKVCVCVDGYHPANNGTMCKPVVYLNEICSADNVCFGDGETIACLGGTCKCTADYIPTTGGRCKPMPKPNLQFALYGEQCGHYGSSRIICHEKWTTCDAVMDGTCVCQYGTREATAEERARHVTSGSSCRLLDYQTDSPTAEQCERHQALVACQNWVREEVFWREWFKRRLRGEPDVVQRDGWDWMEEWKRHRWKLQECTRLMPPTEDDNWSEEVCEIRII